MIITIVLCNSKNSGSLASLLIFCMELDSFSSPQQFLVQKRYANSALSECDYELYDREEYSFWEYTLILFLYSIVLISILLID